ncbi:uncharacterized protein LOC127867343 [Dreissena polymorpha]|uniref:Uncharacterized protein n=1 Tax=Dreissena polymorpha TaxID=45954 RepID=A0A9D4LZP7_DREPO|nr:uncharacterized protein LOC127867343 [Dreissena polymorpha]XP_052264395.1 uncharacterized protein LOC127867343 [Dreissena polymorpha]XP_052264396.1 uncharacterized protein LOC127867343 [Dreissena polymorpha]XP_052264397.1 uncharacterized protein LOC127867343 [Dreissena polymorpha]KAH3866607.1 hypothetical protein DPMN_029704 [Dreissena polymorpha]
MQSLSKRVDIAVVMLSMNVICHGSFHLICSRLIDKSESINILIETEGEDFTCKYRDGASNTTYGIGECIYSVSTCFPPNEPVSGLTFDYSATLTSGILTVLNVNKAIHGTICCYKTYNVLINASLEFTDDCTIPNNGTSSVDNTSESKLAIILGPILGGASVLIPIVIACMCCRRKYETDYQANTMITMEDLDR